MVDHAGCRYCHRTCTGTTSTEIVGHFASFTDDAGPVMKKTVNETRVDPESKF